MPELTFVLEGKDASVAAEDLIAALDGGEGLAARMTPVAALPEVERRAVDPVALATLIVSIPSAALAVWDIVNRIKQRRNMALVRRARVDDRHLTAADDVAHRTRKGKRPRIVGENPTHPG